jgi:hypothetical protein
VNDISFDRLHELRRGRFGMVDAPCPLCGPERRSAINRQRKVLRIWCDDPSFATFKCKRCEIEGYAVDRSTERADPAVIAKARAKAQERQCIEAADSLKKARWLWSQRKPIIGSIAEKYLRECRRYQGRIPGTLGFLPARGEYHPAMIAAFGMAKEIEPGEIVIYDAAVRGVHLTKLKPDGSGKAGSGADKLTIGISNTSPIMLAPPNDLLGLAIAEGVEDALSVHQATGLGAWAAGTAGRLPAMADCVPDYIEAVTIMVDADPMGEKNAAELATRLDNRGIEVRMVRPGGAA